MNNVAGYTVEIYLAAKDIDLIEKSIGSSSYVYNEELTAWAEAIIERELEKLRKEKEERQSEMFAGV